MTIAGLPSSSHSFLNTMIPALASANPEHRFYLLSDHPIEPASNLTVASPPPPATNVLTRTARKLRISKLIKSWEADHVLENEAVEILSDAHADTEQLRADHTGGAQFILWDVREEKPADLVANLRAFSRLKKRQHTGMNLVFWCADKKATREKIKDFSNYKYRGDVRFADETDGSFRDFATAARVVVSFKDLVAGHAGFLALAKDTPLVATDTPISRLVFGPAAVYSTREEAGEALELLYKDEALYGRLAAAAHQLAVTYGLSPTAAKG